MTECNCKEKNSLLKKEEFKNYMIYLLLVILFGAFIIYRNCGK